MAPLGMEPKLPPSPSAAPAAPAMEVTKAARLVVNMKRELMELIKAKHYEAALTVCERRTWEFLPFLVPSGPLFPLALLCD
jgi:hypothetical protein